MDSFTLTYYIHYLTLFNLTLANDIDHHCNNLVKDLNKI